MKKKLKFDILKTKLIIFVDSNDQTRLVNVEKVEKDKEKRIDIVYFQGSLPVFEGKHRSICSNADVNMEVRLYPKCGKGCCDL